MAYTPISNLPPAPQRNDSPSDFVTKADTWVASLGTFTTQTNAAGTYIDGVGAQVQQSADAVQTNTDLAVASSDIAIASANFKGVWNTLTGSLTVPSSVYWNDTYWMLLNDMADVSSEEPSDNAANWAEISGGTGYIVVKPTITVVSPSNLESSAYLSGESYTGALDSVVWQIASDATFTTILVEEDSYPDLTYFYNTFNPDTLYARVRHGSDGHISEWSDGVQFTTAGFDDNSDVDGLTFTAMDTAGNFDSVTDTGFFGEIAATNLIDDYDYRGTWSATIAYTAGQSVVYNNIKYVALTSTTGNQPDTSPTQWAVDNRENLPTGRWLYEHMGFGQGVLQFAGNTASDAGWLKFYSHGKVLYVAKKPFAHTISWDAIACRDGVFGDRTVRIGTKLYKVRLLTGAASDPIALTNITATDSCAQNYGGGSEYNELIYRIHQTIPTCGTDTYDGGPQVGGNWASYTDTDLQIGGTLTGRSKWTQETDANNTSYRVSRGNVRLSTLTSTDSSNAPSYTGWLPVLELISEGDEPYNSDVLGVGPSELTYDFHTDTGYFGTLTSAEFTTGSSLASSIGLTSGTVINDTTSWLKFYWHGQIMYVPMKPLRHSVSWDNIYDRGAVYGVSSMGLFGKGTTAPTVVQNREVTIGTDIFKVKLLKGAKSADIPQATDTYLASSEWGRNSEYNDLIYRVHQDVPLSTSGLTLDGGGQIGDNWASYTDTDLVIGVGDGRIKWSVERNASSTSNRVFRGGARLSYLPAYGSSGADSGYGWLPALILKP